MALEVHVLACNILRGYRPSSWDILRNTTSVSDALTVIIITFYYYHWVDTSAALLSFFFCPISCLSFFDLRLT